MKRPAHVETPREAMPWPDVPQFMADLRARGTDHAPLALALGLEWIVLTCVRATEGLEARWGEIDREARVWTIPADRMKGKTGKKVEHQVPLTRQMLDLLDRATPRHAPKAGDYIFPSRTYADGVFPHKEPLRLLRAVAPGTHTTHGFRSAFFDWSTEATQFPDRLVDRALAHVEKDRVKRVYDRSKMLELRRPLMEAWNAHCVTLAGIANDGDAAALQAAA